MLGKGQRESFRLRTEGEESGFSKEVLSRQREMHRKGECTEGQRFYEWENAFLSVLFWRVCYCYYCFYFIFLLLF